MIEDRGGELTEPARAASSLHDLVPGVMIAERYRLEEQLGRGAMGIVVAAHDTSLNERVALKFLKLEDRAREFRTRFAREARVCAKLRNEHVVRVIDFGTFREAAVYMAMECLDGEDLAAHLRRTGPLEPAVAVDYVVQACEGLAEVHANGVVHRDLKPSNLFLTTRRDGTPLIKILDFGISKWADPNGGLEAELTETGAVLGTPRFMSPEQLFGSSEIDARADVWSLGAILYQLLTGKAPFDASSLPNLCARLATDEPATPPSALRAELPPALDAAILRCLQRDLSRRTPNVAELARELTAAIRTPHPPVVAKKRVLWLAAAMLVVAALAVMAFPRRAPPVATAEPAAAPAPLPSPTPTATASIAVAPIASPLVVAKAPAVWIPTKPKAVASPTTSAPAPAPKPGMLEERQ
jgi:eukaryotic-like serine/threonine-protein kinase